MRPSISKTRGFTLTELIVAIAMLGIIMAIAIPSFTSIIQNNYSVSMANSLTTALLFARSEGVKRNSPISVCATADSSFTSCGSQWVLGWIIFVDVNGNGSIESGTDTILRTESLTGSNGSITPSPSVNVITYNNVGFPMPSSANVTFQIYGIGCKGDYIRNINISLTGRVSTTTATCP